MKKRLFSHERKKPRFSRLIDSQKKTQANGNIAAHKKSDILELTRERAFIEGDCDIFDLLQLKADTLPGKPAFDINKLQSACSPSLTVNPKP